MIKIKRVYEKPLKDDGYRILVDQLWPRGLTKQRAKVDLWMKQIAPSTPLRKWFSHDPERWKEFQRRYKAELKGKETLIDQIKRLQREQKNVTLVYAAKDEDHNNAVVLQGLVNKEKVLEEAIV